MIATMLYYTIIISMPTLGLSVLVGLFVSIVQTTTQIQEQTLTFVPKILAVLGAAILFGPWTLDMISGYVFNLWINLDQYAPH